MTRQTSSAASSDTVGRAGAIKPADSRAGRGRALTDLEVLITREQLLDDVCFGSPAEATGMSIVYDAYAKTRAVADRLEALRASGATCPACDHRGGCPGDALVEDLQALLEGAAEGSA
jgi:hypothetical protein